mmetsp:Transcript_24884/g.68928  ORF Transcript_24884/g.68928 Transcript_24884/m.68928 type:complete len:197 (-) Transcript_24884:103-693(-)
MGSSPFCLSLILLFSVAQESAKACQLEFGGALFTGQGINTQLNVVGITYFRNLDHPSGLETLVLNPASGTIPPTSAVFFCARVECWGPTVCATLTDGIEGADVILQCDPENLIEQCTTMEPTSSPTNSKVAGDCDDDNSDGSLSGKKLVATSGKKQKAPAGKKKEGKKKQDLNKRVTGAQLEFQLNNEYDTSVYSP